VENGTRKVNKRSRIKAWQWRRAGWWWRINCALGRDLRLASALGGSKWDHSPRRYDEGSNG